MSQQEKIRVDVPPGRYVVAVSGGVDSMVLLDLLRPLPRIELIVAHVNHGIRDDSDKDEALVRKVATELQFEYETNDLQLGANTSEVEARYARYEFLRHIRTRHHAKAIITAHHQDDLFETIVINLIRGTGWRGLAPFGSSDILRPLTHVSKAELVTYAKSRQLIWHEDVTNLDQAYLRNYIRHSLAPSLHLMREKLLSLNEKQSWLSGEITQELDRFVEQNTERHDASITIARYQVVMLPIPIAIELLQHIFRELCGNSVERPIVRRALVFAKTARSHKQTQLNKHLCMTIRDAQIVVELRRLVVG